MKPEISPLFFGTPVPSRGFWPLLFMVSALVLLPCGCGKSASAGKSSDHIGTYTLDTINGRKLPFNPLPKISTTEFSSGAITLQSDGTFVHTVYRTSGGTVSKRDATGTYTNTGSLFSLQFKGGGTRTATLESNVFTLNDEDLQLVFRK